MAENKVRIEDHSGNVFYPHTKSDVVFMEDGSTAEQSINNKVGKVAGKHLSTNDYTTAEKNKLNGIAAGAQVNAVTSVAGKKGAVTLGKGDVGLGNADNTSDATKPISTATQAALNTKASVTNLTSLQTTVTQHLAQEAEKRVNTFGITASQSVASDNKYVIPWTLANIRDNDALELLDNGRKIKCKVAGDYFITAIVVYDASDVGYRTFGINYNGTANGQGTYTIRQSTARASSAYVDTSVQLSTIIPLLAGDVIELSTGHNAGSPLLIRTGFTALEIIRL